MKRTNKNKIKYKILLKCNCGFQIYEDEVDITLVNHIQVLHRDIQCFMTKCTICNVNSTSDRTILTHIIANHVSEEYHCLACNYKSDKINESLSHRCIKRKQ